MSRRDVPLRLVMVSEIAWALNQAWTAAVRITRRWR